MQYKICMYSLVGIEPVWLVRFADICIHHTIDSDRLATNGPVNAALQSLPNFPPQKGLV